LNKIENTKINEFKSIVDQHKYEELLNFDLIEVLRANLKTDFELKHILSEEETGKYVSICTTSAFVQTCRIDTDEARRNMITKYANAILENSQKDKEYDEQLNSFTVKTILKQAVCFDALISINGKDGKGNFTKEEISDLFAKAEILSGQLNEKELHLLNNENVMKTLSEFDIGKIKSKENDGITESLYKVIYPELKKEKSEQFSNTLMPDKYEKYITKQYIEAYQKTYGTRIDIKASELNIEYANILVNKGMEKADSLVDLIENSIKQTICFEIIKKDSDIKNLSKEDLLKYTKKQRF